MSKPNIYEYSLDYFHLNRVKIFWKKTEESKIFNFLFNLPYEFSHALNFWSDIDLSEYLSENSNMDVNIIKEIIISEFPIYINNYFNLKNQWWIESLWSFYKQYNIEKIIILLKYLYKNTFNKKDFIDIFNFEMIKNWDIKLNLFESLIELKNFNIIINLIHITNNLFIDINIKYTNNRLLYNFIKELYWKRPSQ